MNFDKAINGGERNNFAAISTTERTAASSIFVGGEQQRINSSRKYWKSSGSVEQILLQAPPLYIKNSLAPLQEQQGDAKTKISQIRSNAAVRRTQHQKHSEIMQQSSTNRIGQYASNKRRVSPMWVGKIDPNAYMRHNRFQLCKDKSMCDIAEQKASAKHTDLQKFKKAQSPKQQIKPIVIKSSHKTDAASNGSVSPTTAIRTVSGFKALAKLVQNASTSHIGEQQQQQQTEHRNVQHESHCKIPFSLQPVNLTQPRQANRTIIIPESNTLTLNRQVQKLVDLSKNSSDNSDQQQQQAQQPPHQFMTKSQTVAAQKLFSYASLQPRYLELNLATLVDKTLYEEAAQGVNNRADGNRPLDQYSQQLQQHLLQVASQKRPTLSKQRAAVNTRRQKDFTVVMKTEVNDVVPSMKLPQRMQSSEGRFTDINLHGNLDGTLHRAQVRSINSCGVDTDQTNNNSQLKRFLQRSAGSKGEWKELSMTNLLCQLESDSAGGGSLGKASPQQLPQLPKLQKKPKHILVQEVRDHHANEIDMHSMKSKRLDTDPSSPKSKKSQNLHAVNFRHIDDSGLDSEKAAVALKSPLRGSRVKERTYIAKLGLMNTMQILTRSQHRNETLRQSQSNKSNSMTNEEEMDNVVRLSNDNGHLLQKIMQQRRLPTHIPSVSATSRNTFTNSQILAAQIAKKVAGSPDEQKIRRIISLESKRQTNNQDVESVMSRPSSQRSTMAKVRRKQKYVEVRKEMMALNKDLSRDVLQTMLNPYEGFDNEPQSNGGGAGLGGGAMTTRDEFKTRRKSKFVPPCSNQNRKSEIRRYAENLNILEKPVSSISSEKEFQTMQILQPMMQSNGAGIQSMPPSEFQKDIIKLDSNSDNKTPKVASAYQANYRRQAQQPISLSPTKIFDSPLKPAIHNISMPMSPNLLPEIGLSNRSSINPITDLPSNGTIKSTPSLRQLNPRKFTVDTISFLQMNMLLSGTASTGGTDFLPPAEQQLFRSMVSNQGQNQQGLGQVKFEPQQLLIQNSIKSSGLVASPKKKKETYKSPYAQQISARRDSSQGQKALTKFDQTMDQLSPWD